VSDPPRFGRSPGGKLLDLILAPNSSSRELGERLSLNGFERKPDVPASKQRGRWADLKIRLPAVAGIIDKARYQAALKRPLDRRQHKIFKSLLEYRIPTEGALRQAFWPRQRREVLIGQPSLI